MHSTSFAYLFGFLGIAWSSGKPEFRHAQPGVGVDIVVRPASFRSSRGSTIIGVICDECAFWRDESGGSSNPSSGAAVLVNDERSADCDFVAVQPPRRALEGLLQALWQVLLNREAYHYFSPPALATRLASSAGPQFKRRVIEVLQCSRL
jgi:hypothetical protein